METKPLEMELDNENNPDSPDTDQPTPPPQPPPETPPEPRPDAASRYASAPEVIDEILREHAGPGKTVVIRRVSPRWCQGYCDTWPLDEPISLADIKSEWGGKRFILQIHRMGGPGNGYERQISVWIDDEPRREGRYIQRPTTEQLSAISSAPTTPAQLLPRTNPAETALLRALQESNDRAWQLVERLAATTPAAQAANPLASLTQAVEALQVIRSAAADLAPQGGSDNAVYVELLKSLFDRDKGPAPTQPPPPAPRAPRRFSAPALPPPPAAAPPAPNPAPVEPRQETPPPPPAAAPPAPNPAPPEHDDLTAEPEGDLPSLAEELAGLSTDDAVDTVEEWISLLGPQRATEILTALQRNPK